jgi:hypothetical protein
MSYGFRGNSFVSHLQSDRVYTFTDAESKRAAFAQMLLDDQIVRDAAQQRAQSAGIKKPLSDKEILAGTFMPDRRTVVERVADEVTARGATHDAFQVAIETVRGTQRLTDSAAKREADEATIQRLEEKSARWIQERGPALPAVEPNTPAARAAMAIAAGIAMRKTADQLQKSFSGTPDERAQQRGRIEALLRGAGEQDATAIVETERAAKAKANEPWLIDADATLFLIAKDSSIPQETVNAVRDFRERLVNCEATGEQWIEFANGVDAQRKQIRADKIAVKNVEIANLEQQKTAIRAGTDTEPPAQGA